MRICLKSCTALQVFNFYDFAGLKRIVKKSKNNLSRYRRNVLFAVQENILPAAEKAKIKARKNFRAFI